MRKRIVTIGLLLSMLTGGGRLAAQSDVYIDRYVAMRESSRRTMDNSGFWTVSLAGGGSAYFGEHDMWFTNTLGDLVAPMGKVTVSRWFSSVWGVRFQADGGTLKNYSLVLEEEIARGEFYYADSYLQVVTNVLNWGRTKRTQRPISICLIGGVGMAWTPSRESVPQQFSPAAVLGAQLTIRLTDFWSLGLEVDGTIVKDNFNGYTGGRQYEGWATAMMGLVYRFP